MPKMIDILDCVWPVDHDASHGIMLRAAIEIPMLWEEIRPIFHANLDRLMREKSLSRRQLSLAITSNEFYITKMIKGDSAPGFDKILDMSNALDVHYTALFETELSRIASVATGDDDRLFDDLLFSLTRYTNAVAMINNKEIGPQEIIAKWREKKGELTKLVDILEHVDIFEVTPDHPFLKLERIGEQSLASQVLNGPKFAEYTQELGGPLTAKLEESRDRYQSVLDENEVIFTSETIETKLLSGRSLILKYECYLLPGREKGIPKRVLTFADPTEVRIIKTGTSDSE